MSAQSLRQVGLDALKTAFETAAIEITDFLNVTLDDDAKKGLISVLDKVKLKLETKEKT